MSINQTTILKSHLRDFVSHRPFTQTLVQIVKIHFMSEPTLPVSQTIKIDSDVRYHCFTQTAEVYNLDNDNKDYDAPFFNFSIHSRNSQLSVRVRSLSSNKGEMFLCAACHAFTPHVNGWKN